MNTLSLSRDPAGPQEERNVSTSLMDVRPAPAVVEPAAMGGIDVPAALRKRPLLALSVLIGTLLAGAPYLLKKAPQVFHAEAAIYVSPTYFKNLQQDREQLQVSYSTLVNQQILTLRRYDVLHEALVHLEQQGIHYKEPGESDESAVARLTRDLDVQHITDSYEVLLGIDSPVHDWVAPIVNTIANTYLEKGKADDQADRASRQSALTVEEAKLRSELQVKLDQQAALSQDLLSVSLDKASPIDETLLTGARQAQEDAHRRRMEAEAQLSVAEASRSGANKSSIAALTEEAVAADTNLRTTMNSLVQRRSELQAKILGLTPQHPFRQAADKDIASINDQLAKLPLGAADESATRMIAKLKTEVDRTRLVESELGNEAQGYASKVQSRVKQVQTAQGISADIDRLRRDLTAVNSRLQEMNTGDADPSSYLRMFSAAQTPIEPKKASTKKVLGVLFGLAFFLALVLPVAADLLDQRIVSPAEVKRAIGFPPLGLVLEPATATRGFAEEHFRRLVNGIQRGMAAQGAKCVVVMPLDDARNPASLVTDLASALRLRGLKTVIVDANPGPGSQDASRQDDISTPVPTVPAPVHTGNTLVQNGDSRVPVERTRIPVAGGLGSFVREVRQEYDVVLIDTPPLELSADAEFLASVSDITLMVAESGKATRRELAEGTARLGRIGAPSVGVIMSQVCLRRAGSALRRDFKKFNSLSGGNLPRGKKAASKPAGGIFSAATPSDGAKPSRFRFRVKLRPHLGLGRKRTEL